jgi:EAL domain-containing protein (putative c-di-GMP-specific phosphodiesterase class I)
VGLAYAGPGEHITNQLLVDADIAMYQAKRKGGAGHQIIDLREALRSSDRDTLEHDLRAAFARDELEVAYQPVVRSADGLIIGVEALLRWTHVDRGAVSPIAIVGVAERSGLIGDIGAWVLRRACEDRCGWRFETPQESLELAVNVSGRQLMSPNFCRSVAGILAATGMEPSKLILEVTENIFIEDSARAMTVLADLKDLGVRIALDDFGTGYSSLSYLRTLPLDIVKIDQSFIADIDQAPSGGAIVAAVTNLAYVLGLTVIAEGVETQDQHDGVVEMGCTAAQGYYFARPMPSAAIQALLAAPPEGVARLPVGVAGALVA